jgi:hypothetical protein
MVFRQYCNPYRLSVVHLYPLYGLWSSRSYRQSVFHLCILYNFDNAEDSAEGQIVIPLVSPAESSYDKKIKEVSIFVVLIPTVGTIAGALT